MNWYMLMGGKYREQPHRPVWAPGEREEYEAWLATRRQEIDHALEVCGGPDADPDDDRWVTPQNDPGCQEYERRLNNEPDPRPMRKRNE